MADTAATVMHVVLVHLVVEAVCDAPGVVTAFVHVAVLLVVHNHSQILLVYSYSTHARYL